MKILWICNIMLPMVAEYLGRPASNKEGWLTGLAERILQNRSDNHIELAIAFPVTDVSEEKKLMVPTKEPDGMLVCYGFAEDVIHPECYPPSLEKRLKEIVEDWKPDVVHCFGTEYPHTLAATRVYPAERILLGIQGSCALYAKCYYADLPEYVINRVTFRDFIKKDSIRKQQEKFVKRGSYELEAIRGALHVTGRTHWDKAFTGETNPEATYHFMNETLRSNFYEGSWQEEQCEPYRIFLSQGDYPIKGLHYMLKAMPKILEAFPQAKVYVAGNNITNHKSIKERLKLSSYGKYILKLMEEEDLSDKVVFLGKMNATQMKEQFLKCHLFVCPSAIENSPNSLGEAMLLGVPSVVSRVGGVASVFEDGVDGITYPGYGDPCYREEESPLEAQGEQLARAVIRMWSDRALRNRLTANAVAHGRRTHDGQANYKRLIEIYKEIVS